MAKRPAEESDKNDKTVPVSIRMRAGLRTRTLAYADRFRFPPTLTELIEDALTEYLERHEDEPQPPASRGKR